jgi:hypothetical protein
MSQLDSKTNDLLNVITSLEERISDNPAGEPATGIFDALDKAMDGYRSYLSSVIPADSYLNAESLLDVSGYRPLLSPDNNVIRRLPGLNSLALLKNRLLTSELYSLKKLAETR